jgi:hypothetical protein
MDESTKIADLTVGEFRELMIELNSPLSPAEKDYRQKVQLGLIKPNQQDCSIAWMHGIKEDDDINAKRIFRHNQELAMKNSSIEQQDAKISRMQALQAINQVD